MGYGSLCPCTDLREMSSLPCVGVFCFKTQQDIYVSKIDSFFVLLRVKSSDTINPFLGANGLLIENTDILPTVSSRVAESIESMEHSG